MPPLSLLFALAVYGLLFCSRAGDRAPDGRDYHQAPGAPHPSMSSARRGRTADPQTPFLFVSFRARRRFLCHGWSRVLTLPADHISSDNGTGFFDRLLPPLSAGTLPDRCGSGRCPWFFLRPSGRSYHECFSSCFTIKKEICSMKKLHL